MSSVMQTAILSTCMTNAEGVVISRDSSFPSFVRVSCSLSFSRSLFFQSLTGTMSSSVGQLTSLTYLYTLVRVVIIFFTSLLPLFRIAGAYLSPLARSLFTIFLLPTSLSFSLSHTGLFIKTRSRARCQLVRCDSKYFLSLPHSLHSLRTRSRSSLLFVPLSAVTVCW